MTLLPLLKENSRTLKSLCASCGLPKTGAKTVLVSRLREAAQQFQPTPPSARILSIDLGLKNFAFSLLTPAPLPKTTKSKTKQKPLPSLSFADPAKPSALLTSPVHLHAWHRLDLTLPLDAAQSSSPLPPTPPARNRKSKKAEAEPEEDSTPTKSKRKPEPSTSTSTAFTPTTLASTTATLVQTVLLPLRPTHILIERQRFRTGGASAVLEWTVRVNQLEAMLHAAFAMANFHAHATEIEIDMAEGGKGKRNGVDGGGKVVVESVTPKVVAGYLFPSAGAKDEDGLVEGKKRKKKATSGAAAAYKLLKKEKVNMLSEFLATENDGGGAGLVKADGKQAKEVVGLFLEAVERKRVGKRRAKRKEGEEENYAVEDMVSKMDDLSDSVLQGMVWLQWQRNLEGLIQERPELLEPVEE
ncbi:mitochondrial resolvase Ydc2 [Dichotomopilus funicola]|uniref:Mitochondrial resolvase Ydc2 n=1 Tax=Dichotomopilus funicola TaxID=1934379 RepID=A0AAN6UY40_9PEZI|nr:mitochondrial resolvase Ydc2 [Dichotomopilus funicola]